MSSINFATREISCKIVYYGPGLSGKTTNLQVIHQKLPQEKRTDMVSLATEGDRTLFFDFLPLNLGDIKGFKTKFQLYTVPGQVYYNSTRKLVLRGVDGVVFVADSQRNRQPENMESLQNLRQNLRDYGMDLDELPYVLQYNKRDMDGIYSLDDLNGQMNPKNVPFFPATAHNGKGVVSTLKSISMLVIENFNLKQGILRKAAESGNFTGVHDVTFSGQNLNISQTKESAGAAAAPALQAFRAAPAAPARSGLPELDDSSASPFRMPSFATGTKPSPSPAATSPVQSPAPPVSSAGAKLGAAPDEDVELKPYVPKKK
jgi:signal recognition particle receptor subunit beta